MFRLKLSNKGNAGKFPFQLFWYIIGFGDKEGVVPPIAIGIV